MQPQDNYTRRARITQVIDGETIVAEIDSGFGHTNRQRLTLLGVNASDDTQAACNFIMNRVLGQKCVIQTIKGPNESYLAEVAYHVPNCGGEDRWENLAAEMIAAGLARSLPVEDMDSNRPGQTAVMDAAPLDARGDPLYLGRTVLLDGKAWVVVTGMDRTACRLTDSDGLITDLRPHGDINKPGGTNG